MNGTKFLVVVNTKKLKNWCREVVTVERVVDNEYQFTLWRDENNQKNNSRFGSTPTKGKRN